MARYFFHIQNGQEVPDETGTLLNSIADVRREAMMTVSDVLRGYEDEPWKRTDWSLRVTDEAGTSLFTLRFSMKEHSP